MEVHRTSNIEISVTMTPEQAEVIAYVLRHAADDLITQDWQAKEYANSAYSLASELKRAL